MASQTKKLILERHQANTDLNTALLAQATRDGKDLSADDMLSPLDEQIIAGASAAMEDGQTHYVDVPGIAPLRAAVAEQINDCAGSAYGQGNIIITAGMQESRFLTIQKIGELYESIGVPAVVHPGVRKALGVRQLNLQQLPVDIANGGLPSLPDIAAAAASGCRLFYLESPARLSGAAYAAEDVAAIHQIISDHDAGVIWDQGLATWIDGEYESMASLDANRERSATIGEAWPGMGLASWFIAYIAAPEKWIPAMQSQKQIMAICTSTAAQYAALEASSIYTESHEGQLRQLRKLRAELLNVAYEASLDVIAGAAVNILALLMSTDKLNQLRAAGFDVADGSLFGAPNVARLNVSNTTADALQALS